MQFGVQTLGGPLALQINFSVALERMCFYQHDFWRQLDIEIREDFSVKIWQTVSFHYYVGA